MDEAKLVEIEARADHMTADDCTALTALVAEVRRLRAENDGLRKHTDAAVDGVRAMLPAALAAARREGAEAMRERGARMLRTMAPAMTTASETEHFLSAAEMIAALPLDAPGGAPDCTGITAQWCPRCGDCACPLLREGNVEGGRTLNDPNCPLHAPSSPHGDAPGGAT